MSLLTNALLRFGKIITCDIKTAVRVSVTKNVMDERLLMYFIEYDLFYAYDTRNECKVGDYVTIRELQDQKNRKITHIVEKLIYKAGHFIDPLTGEKCVGEEYHRNINRTRELFPTTSLKFEKEEHSPS